MRTIDIPIPDPKKPPQLRFPERCVNCGGPKVRSLPVRLNTGGQKRGQMMEVGFHVPLCSECAAREDRIGTITWIPFFGAGLLTCILVFIPVGLLAPEAPGSQTQSLPLVLGASAGMTAGILIGTLVEYVLKRALAPAFGELLSRRPLTVISIFRDSADLIGLSTRFADGRRTLKLIFENEESAQEFLALNSQEIR